LLADNKDFLLHNPQEYITTLVYEVLRHQQSDQHEMWHLFVVLAPKVLILLVQLLVAPQ